MSKPQVFIIESLRFNEEKLNLFEGRVVSQILHLGGKKSSYYYIRTKAEFKKLLSIFHESDYRYLHISCHGSSREMHTTIDAIPFFELGKMLCPVLNHRRLFLSACSMTNKRLAEKILPNSECFSIVGPNKEVDFSDAAILWSSFYHLMFKSNPKAMQHKILEDNVRKVTSMYNVSMNYYRKKKGADLGFISKSIRP
jgi:hypothetical protein